MSIRMRKQSPRRDLNVINPGSPGPGMYNVNSDKDIGRTKNRMQEWKTPMRKVEWFVRKTESPDVLFSQMMDHKGIARMDCEDEVRGGFFDLLATLLKLMLVRQNRHAVRATAQDDDGYAEQPICSDVLGWQESIGEDQIQGSACSRVLAILCCLRSEV
eukprot:749201-Hanusia_phi.AAC.1